MLFTRRAGLCAAVHGRISGGFGTGRTTARSKTMRSQLLCQVDGLRAFTVVLSHGDEAIEAPIVLDEHGQPAVHINLVLGRRDGSALAGHLGRGVVRPTLEVLITETPAHLRRVKDPEAGLGLSLPRR